MNTIGGFFSTDINEFFTQLIISENELFQGNALFGFGAVGENGGPSFFVGGIEGPGGGLGHGNMIQEN